MNKGWAVTNKGPEADSSSLVFQHALLYIQLFVLPSISVSSNNIVLKSIAEIWKHNEQLELKRTGKRNEEQ